jgi:hypothetical protein
MKLRELLQCCSLDEVYRKLYRMHHRNEKTVNPANLAKLSRAYGKVVRRLLDLSKEKPAYPIAIHRVYESPGRKGERSAYHACSFRNPDYTPPPRGRKPWHSKSEDKDDHPDGCYNASYNGHQKYFGMDLAPWEDLVDAEVMHPKYIAAATVVAIVLWEITFFGFNNKKAIRKMVKLANRAMRELEHGEGAPMDICLKHPKANWKTLRKLATEAGQQEAEGRRLTRASPVLAKRGSKIMTRR